METLDRIERKLRKVWDWCEMFCQESKENHEHYLFQESYNLVVGQVHFNLNDIDELRIDYAHGVNISQGIKKLKWEFNFTTRFYRDLCSLYRDAYRPLRFRRRPLRPQQWTFFLSNMDNQCQVCGQTRPCCHQSLFEMADNWHPKLMIPLKGEVREVWGLGSVWKTCCGTNYGMYYDEENHTNHVRSFLM